MKHAALSLLLALPTGAYSDDLFWNFTDDQYAVEVSEITLDQWVDVHLALGLDQEGFETVYGIDPAEADNPFEARREAAQRFEDRQAAAQEQYAGLTKLNLWLYFDWVPAVFEGFDLDDLELTVSYPGGMTIEPTKTFSFRLVPGLSPDGRPAKGLEQNPWGQDEVAQIALTFPDDETAERFFDASDGFEDLEISGMCRFTIEKHGYDRCQVFDFALRSDGVVLGRSHFDPENRMTWTFPDPS